MIKVVECTSTIQAGQSINDNVLQVFLQTPLDKNSSIEQFIGWSRSYKSITHLYPSINENSIKAINSDLRDRYYNRLQDTRDKAWSNTNTDKWMKVLSKHGEIILNNAMMIKWNNLNNE